MIGLRGHLETQAPNLAPCRILGLVHALRMDDGQGYEAVECNLQPTQIAEGSGLFTSSERGEGYLLAGVCNFSSPSSSAGLYASPRMIYPILDKNGLQDLYAEDPNLSPAPEPGFPVKRTGPNAAASGGRLIPDPDRLRAVEQRVDAIDGKLDEVLRLLKKPN